MNTSMFCVTLFSKDIFIYALPTPSEASKKLRDDIDPKQNQSGVKPMF